MVMAATSSSFVFLAVGTGIGMALVIDGHLYRGAHGAAGEVAYLPIGMGDPRDPSNRRRGAFEEAAAAAGIVRIARKLGIRLRHDRRAHLQRGPARRRDGAHAS